MEPNSEQRSAQQVQMFSVQKIAIGFLFLSVVALVLGTLLPWWTGALDTGSFEIGMRKMSLCIGDVCRDRPLAMDSGSEGWAQLGSSVLGTSYVAAFFLLIAGVARLADKTPKTVFWVAGAMSLFTEILALLFVFAHPTLGEVVPTWGMACTLTGGFVGAISVTLANFATSSANSPSRRKAS